MAPVKVTVLAQDGRTPTKGAHVRVKGRVNESATFGGQRRSACTWQTERSFEAVDAQRG